MSHSTPAGPEPSPLATLTADSTHILVVRPVEPLRRVEMVPVPGVADGGREFPPYRRTWDRFEVLAVLKAVTRPVAPGEEPEFAVPTAGETVEVREAFSDLAYDLHVAYVRDDFTFTEEDRGHRQIARPADDREDRIVFCLLDGGELQFTTYCAEEGLSVRAKVERLI